MLLLRSPSDSPTDNSLYKEDDGNDGQGEGAGEGERQGEELRNKTHEQGTITSTSSVDSCPITGQQQQQQQLLPAEGKEKKNRGIFKWITQFFANAT